MYCKLNDFCRVFNLNKNSIKASIALSILSSAFTVNSVLRVGDLTFFLSLRSRSLFNAAPPVPPSVHHHPYENGIPNPFKSNVLLAAPTVLQSILLPIQIYVKYDKPEERRDTQEAKTQIGY